MPSRALLVPALFLFCLPQANADASDNEAMAKAWIQAMHHSRDDTWFLVNRHMAEEGVYQQGRYVGLGITLDSRTPGQLVVKSVPQDSPAAGVLRPGDRFLSVRGEPISHDNANAATLRGRPGETMAALILRQGLEHRVLLRPDIIETAIDKPALLDSIAHQDAGIWSVNHGQILEVVGSGKVVYVMHEIADVDEASGLPFRNRFINRFEFNDAGQVIRLSSQGESRFVLEQLGYRIGP